jgi:LysM repeat protein
MGSTIPSPAAQPRPTGPVSREEIVPSWEIDGRYGAESPEEPGGNRLDTVLTAIAVLAILAIGVAAVLFLPGLLSHGTPSRTPGPSFVLPSAQPSALHSGLPSVAPSGAPSVGPSVAPTAPASVGPVGSPRLYKIKSGDSLAKIANKYHVTIQQILDANPTIVDANHIEVGQTIVIPPPAPASP